jgi:hypothetical protein
VLDPGAEPTGGHRRALGPGTGRDRPLPRGSARAGGRDDGVGQVRAAADTDRRPRAAPSAGPVLLPARGLQGRRGIRRGRRASPHRRDGDRPRRPDDGTGTALADGRARQTGGDPGRAPRPRHRSTAGRRRPRQAGHRRGRVRHPRRGTARLRTGSGVHRPARTVPRGPPGARDPTPRRCGLPGDPRQLHAEDLPAHHRRGGLPRRAGGTGGRAPARGPPGPGLSPDRQ